MSKDTDNQNSQNNSSKENLSNFLNKINNVNTTSENTDSVLPNKSLTQEEISSKAYESMYKKNNEPKSTDVNDPNSYDNIYAYNEQAKKNNEVKIQEQNAALHAYQAERAAKTKVTQEKITKDQIAEQTEQQKQYNLDRQKQKEIALSESLTVGDRKQIELKYSNKHNKLSQSSEYKQMELYGMSPEEIEATTLTPEEFIVFSGASTKDEVEVAMYNHEMALLDKANATSNGKNSEALYDAEDNAFGNAAVGAASSLRSLVGNVIASPLNVYSRSRLKGVTTDDIAVARGIQNKLDSNTPLNEEEELFMTLKAPDQLNRSLFDTIKWGVISKGAAKGINEDYGSWDKYVDHSGVEELGEKASSSYREFEKGNLSGFELFTDVIDEVVSNPKALIQVTAESIPYMIAASVSLPATIAVGAEENYNEILEDFKNNNNGQLPTIEEAKELYGLSLMASGVDVAGDRFAGSMFKNAGGGKAIKALSAKAGTGVFGEVAKRTANGVISSAGEFGAEGGSDLIKQKAGGGDIDLSQSFGAGVLGAGAGGGAAVAGNIKDATVKVLKAGSETVAEKGVEKLKEAKDKTVAKTKSGQQVKSQLAYDKAMKDSDVTALPKEDSKEYNVVSDSKARIQIFDNKIKEADKSGDQLKSIEAQIAKSDEITKVNEQINANTNKLKEDKTLTTEQQQQIIDENALLIEVSEGVNVNTKDVSNEAKELSSTKSSEIKGSSNRVNNLIEAIKSNPTALGSKEIQSVYNNKELNLNPEQVKSLKQAAVTAKSLSQVSSEFRDGGIIDNIERKGLNQYLSESNKFVKTGDRASAESSLKDLKSWRKQQDSKIAKGTWINSKGEEKPHTDEFIKQATKELAVMDRTIKQVERNLINIKDIPTLTTPPKVDINDDVNISSTPVEKSTKTESALEQNDDNQEDTNTEEVNDAIVEEVNIEEDIVDEVLNKDINLSSETTQVEATNVAETKGEVVEDKSKEVKSTTTTKQYRDNLVGLVKKMTKSSDVTKEQANEVVTAVNKLVLEGKTSKEIINSVTPIAKKAFNTKSNNVMKNVKEFLRDTVDSTYETISGDSLSNNLTSQTDENLKSLNEVEKKTKEVMESNNTKETKNKKLRAIQRSHNWLKSFFTKGNISNVLQTNENFFSDKNTVASKASSYIDRELTTQDNLLLDTYNNFREEIINSMSKADINVSGTQGKDSKPVSFLLNEDGSMDDNVKDAIISAMFNYLATSSSDSLYNDSKRINDILGLDENASTPSEATSILQDKGLSPDIIIEAIGKDVVANLNIKTTGNAPMNLNNNMIGSIGILAVSMLRDTGYLKRVDFTIDEANALNRMKADIDENFTFEESVKYPIGFSQNLRVDTKKVEGRDKPANNIELIQEVMKESNKSKPLKGTALWESLFSGLTYSKMPSTSVPTKVATTVKNTNKKITRKVRTALKKHQERKHFLRTKELDTLLNMDKESVLTMMGKVDIESIHISKRESQALKNEDLERSYNNMVDFYEELKSGGDISAPFYFTHSQWKNGRFGINETLVNPQANKFHRSLIFQEGWRVNIDLNEDSTAENKQYMQLFWVGLHEVLGISTQEDFNNDTDMNNAVNTIIALRNKEEVSIEEQEEMAKYIASKKEAMTYDGLNQIANYIEAVRNGSTSFESTLGIELDGKTNGVIISILQYGAYSTEEEMLNRLRKGGLFAEGSDYTSIEEFLSDTQNKDAYQEVGYLWNIEVENTIESEENKKRKARNKVTIAKLTAAKTIFDFSNAKFLRNISKNPLMVTSYGASAKSIIDSLKVKFVDEIYGQLEVVSDNYINAENKFKESSKLKDENGMREAKAEMNEFKQEYKNIKENVKIMLGGAKPSFYDTNITDAKEILLNYREVKTLGFLVSNIYGTSINTSIEQNYEGLQKGRTKVTNAVSVNNNTYKVLRNTLVDEKLKEKIASGLVVESMNYLTNDEMSEIERELAGIRPQMTNSLNTVINKEGEFNTEYTIDLAKENINRSKEDNTGAFKVSNSFFKGMNYNYTKGVSTFDDTGVAPGVISIHMLDAIVMYDLYNSDIDSLGVHDANYFGIKDVVSGGQLQNKSFYETMKDNTVPVETKKVTDRANKEKRKIIAKYNLNSDEINEEIFELTTHGTGLDKISGEYAYDLIMNELNDEVSRVAELKKGTLDRVGYVDQYNFETKYSKYSVKKYVSYESDKAAGDALVEKSVEVIKEHGNDVSYGSSNTEGSVNPSDYDTATNIDSTNSVKVFDSLPVSGGKQENEVHLGNLRSIVSKMSDKLVEPFNLYMRTQEDVDNYGLATATDIFITNLKQGVIAKSGVLAQGIQMSTQEIMAHEMTHILYQDGLKRSSVSKSAIERMFNAAKEQLDYTAFINDINNATQQDIDNAKETYEYVFNNVEGNHLDEFAAFGVTNEQFGKALNNVKVRPAKIFSGSAYEQLTKVLGYLIDLISSRLLNKNINTNQENLTRLLDNLLRVNASKHHTILQGAAKVLSVPAQGVDLMLAPVEHFTKKIANTDWVKNNNNNVIRVAGKYITNPKDVDTAIGTLHGQINTVRRVLGDQRESMMSSLYDEMVGRTRTNAWLGDLMRKSNQMIDIPRKQIKEAMISNLEDSFSVELNDKEKENMNKILIKLDIVSLSELGNYTRSDIYDVIRSNDILDNKINNLEALISTYNNGSFYIEQAKNLGNFMVEGKSRLPIGLLTSYNIAIGAGHPNIKVSSDIANKVDPIISQLATLYGIKSSDISRRQSIANIMVSELEANSDTDGITSILNAHSSIKEAGRKQFVTESEYKALAIKGYTKEDFREDVGIEYGTNEDHDRLVALGYIRKDNNPILRDKTDPLYNDKDAQVFMYISPNLGLASYASGVVSLTNNSVKGTELANSNSVAGIEDAYTNFDENVNSMTNEKLKDLKPNNGNNMVPVISPTTGEIVNYRYMMSENTKDSVLGKDNNVFRVLGSMTANTIDKVNSKKINREIVETTKQNFDNDKTKNLDEYILVGKNSENSKARETYNLLPQEMKNDIREVWGNKGMLVRKEDFNALFGFRKLRLADMFAKEPEARNAAEKVVIGLLTPLLGDKVAYKVSKAQDWIEAIVQEIKDIVVVRSGVVTLANMLSNTLGLIMNGVSVIDAFRLQYQALVGSNALLKDIKTKQGLELKLNAETNPVKARRLQAEINKLDKRMQGNPALISYQAGLMPNIVDDIAADANLNTSIRSSTQKAVSDKIDKGLGFLPAFGQDFIKGALGLPDSSAYKVLNNLVMQTDFMARHALLIHKMNQEKASNGSISDSMFNEMVGQVEETFINFNAPTHKGTQFLNDIGVAWFTKYNVRVIKTILNLFKDNPKRAFSTIIGGGMLGLDIIDNSIITSLSGIPLIETFDNPINKAIDSIGLIPAVNVVN